MPVLDLPSLVPVLQARRRLVGIDVGTKTLGIAISDGLGISATPLETIRRTKFMKDAAALVAILNKQQAGGIVVGLPINMDGSEGPRCQSVRQFATNVADVLKSSTDLPIAFWDERLSTAAVTRLMIEADLTRARRAELVDKMAAAYILQGALDFLKRAPEPA